MARFKVLRRVDAWIDYVAEIEAESASVAASLARNRAGALAWVRVGEEELQHNLFVTLDESGAELEETTQNRG